MCGWIKETACTLSKQDPALPSTKSVSSHKISSHEVNSHHHEITFPQGHPTQCNKYRIAGIFRRVQFSWKSNLQRSNFADGRSRTALPTIPGWLRLLPHAPVGLKTCEGLVSFPDQVFCVRPADPSKKRVWRLSLRKLGQVYIQRSVNWVIVGVN